MKTISMHGAQRHFKSRRGSQTRLAEALGVTLGAVRNVLWLGEPSERVRGGIEREVGSKINWVFGSAAKRSKNDRCARWARKNRNRGEEKAHG